MPTSKSVQVALSLIENDKSKILGLTVGKHANMKPGQYIPKLLRIPSSLASDKTYIIVCLDMDAPFPSFSILGPLLHWNQPGLRPKLSSPILEVQDDTPSIANYVGPGPPPISGPHRYVFLLYEQPEGFDAKKHAPPPGRELPLTSRARYDLDAWENQAGLGLVLAAAYFNSN